MCRWIVYAASEEAQLDEVILKPKNSLVHQSFSATWHPGFTDRNNAVLNADGLGLGWYGPQASLYKSISPAWSDQNLTELSSYVTSSLIFGHVRAASPGSVVSQENCHPFRFGRLIFMHNGHIEGFSKVKRAMIQCCTEEAFQMIKGVTDSEHAFAIIVSNLHDPSRSTPFAPEELISALKAAIAKILHLVEKAGITTGFTSLNFALTDGETVLTSRFCDKWPNVPPPSLYFSYAHSGELREELASSSDNAGPGDGSGNAEQAAKMDTLLDDAHGVESERWTKDVEFLQQTRLDSQSRALLVASEPSTMGSKLSWLCMPANSLLVYTKTQGHFPNLEHLQM